MTCKALLNAIAIGCLIAAASALVPSAQAPIARTYDDIVYRSPAPVYWSGKLRGGCFEEPGECGLIVW